MEIKIYTDGSCSKNPGPGGWGAVILLDREKKQIFGGERLTTNNRMELTAAIKGIEYCINIEREKITFEIIQIFTDSMYVKDGITRWINRWEKNNWKTTDKKDVKNVDLWQKLKKLTVIKKINWHWVKGHSNNALNDLADNLAKNAIPN